MKAFDGSVFLGTEDVCNQCDKNSMACCFQQDLKELTKVCDGAVRLKMEFCSLKPDYRKKGCR